jgi:hypothetical protein
MGMTARINTNDEDQLLATDIDGQYSLHIEVQMGNRCLFWRMWLRYKSESPVIGSGCYSTDGLMYLALADNIMVVKSKRIL